MAADSAMQKILKHPDPRAGECPDANYEEMLTIVRARRRLQTAALTEIIEEEGPAHRSKLVEFCIDELGFDVDAELAADQAPPLFAAVVSSSLRKRKRLQELAPARPTDSRTCNRFIAPPQEKIVKALLGAGADITREHRGTTALAEQGKLDLESMAT